MKFIIFLLIIFSLIMAPFFVFADCNQSGTTVVFINGMFTFSEADAKKSKDLLEQDFKYYTKRDDVIFHLGYNPSHILGIDDIFKVVQQAYSGGFLDYDLTNILRQTHDDLTTQKILLVGHSQGTFYTNAAYNYLIGHGVDKNSIAVYNVGTPADFVAGNGKYLNSSTDKVINQIVEDLTTAGFARKPLPSNINLPLSAEESANPLGGHDFSNVYLAEAPDRIIGDMDSEINNLQADGQTKTECFAEPKTGLAFLIEDQGYSIADGIVNNPNDFVTSPFQTPKQLADFANALFQSIYNFGWQVASAATQIVTQNNIWGGSLSSFLVQNTSNNPLPSATPSQTSNDAQVQNAPAPIAILIPTSSQQEDSQDQLDDIQEKLDIIKSQIQILIAEQNPVIQLASATAPQTPDDKNNQNQNAEQNNNQNTNNSNQNSTATTGGGGGGVAMVYPKILISEVQPEDTQEFVELYNPNNQDVDLTGWYLQRKTAGSSSWGTFATKTLFSGKIISKSGYFLIARTGYFSGSANIFVDTAITKDNAFALKNPNEVISDKLGFGSAQDPETAATSNSMVAGQSIGRKVLADGTEQDTDNNSNDFELQIPTPYAQNETYVDSSTQPTPSPLPTPSPTPMPVVPLKNILINEIQIDSVAGTGGTDDDWVELYNPNDSPVSLAGWSIQKSGYSKTNCSVNTSFYSKQFDSSAVVPANGFYLVVSTKANDSLKALAVPPNGMTIGWSLSDNNTIYLVKNTDKITDYKDADIVEEVGYGTACFSEGDSPAISPPDGGSIERKKLGTDTDNNLADFKISNDPTPNAASPKSYIQDATNYSTCMTTTNPGTTFYNLDIKWNSLTLNLDHYQIQYNLNGGTWQDWLAATTDTEKTFQTAYSLYQDKIYIFRARTYDKDGNVGDWAEITIDLSNPVVINEVAYYGIGDTTLNHKQWMELYNRSGNPIDLTGWQIVSNNNNYLNVILKGTIPANGYFILEREDDSAGAVSDVSANQTFSGVIPTGDMIYLKNQNNRQMDEFYSDRSQGQSQENGNYYSLERISPYSFGQDSKNWELSNSAGFGTPNRQNSVYQLYTSNFTNSFVEDTTLKASLSPYLFQDSTYIFPGITLTIEPGTVIKFSGDHPNLTVDGTLNAIGAAGQPIVFTSVADADYGGTGQANPGQWAGIHFNKDSSGASDLENIIVRYAGANIYAQDYGAGISIESSSITLKNSVIEKNLNSGLKMHGSSSTIDSVQFNGNQEIDSDTLYGKAIYNEDGSPSITNCVFKGNYDAIYLTNGGTDDNAPVISGNDFENNNDAAIYVSGKDIYPDFSGNKAAGNGHNAIVFTEQIEKSMTMQNDLPYLVKEALNVPQNTTLTIQPGTIVKFSDSSLAVDGTLNAVGATGQPIVFTSVDDDDYGGHMENSNDTSPVEPGQWSGIIFKNDSAGSDLENIVLRYAGGTLGGNFGAGIEVENSIISLKNSLVQKNTGNGVRLINSASTIDSVQFLDNKAENGANPVSGLYIMEGSPEVASSNFDDNDYGIYLNNMGNPSTPNLQQNTFGTNIIKDIFDNNPSPDTP